MQKKGFIINNCLTYQNGRFRKCSFLIENNLIKQIAKQPIVNKKLKSYDFEGKIAIPGLVDIHTHLRELGFEYKETIATGTKAAAQGGYTTLCCMPNLKPEIDSVKNIKLLLKKIKKHALVNVFPYCSITLGRKVDSNLVDMKAISPYCVGFSNDGCGIATSKLMDQAMKLARQVNRPIVAHCEDADLVPKNGAINAGPIAKKFNVIGIPAASEYQQVIRDVNLAIKNKCQYHVCHISSWQSLQAIKKACKLNPLITCEVTPHHLLLTENDIKTNDGKFKMNPPLKTKKDQKYLLEGLKNGDIQIIASDHAPHSLEEKNCQLDQASFGVVSLDFAFALLFTKLVEAKIITLSKLVKLMAINPVKIFKLPSNEIAVGNVANITIFDPKLSLLIDPSKFASKGKSTPFEKLKCQGWPIMTICNGKIVYLRK